MNEESKQKQINKIDKEGPVCFRPDLYLFQGRSCYSVNNIRCIHFENCKCEHLKNPKGKIKNNDNSLYKI